MDKIIIKGARENNLQNVNLELPKNKLEVQLKYWALQKKRLWMF